MLFRSEMVPQSLLSPETTSDISIDHMTGTKSYMRKPYNLLKISRAQIIFFDWSKLGENIIVVVNEVELAHAID